MNTHQNALFWNEKNHKICWGGGLPQASLSVEREQGGDPRTFGTQPPLFCDKSNSVYRSANWWSGTDLLLYMVTGSTEGNCSRRSDETRWSSSPSRKSLKQSKTCSTGFKWHTYCRKQTSEFLCTTVYLGWVIHIHRIHNQSKALMPTSQNATFVSRLNTINNII